MLALYFVKCNVVRMKFVEQFIAGVFIIEPKRFADGRGYFSEIFKQELFDKKIGAVRFVQDNESCSSYGVLRGLHFQRGEYAQAKLVRVSQGAVLDVVVDLRKDSVTFGKYLSVELSAENGRQLFIPRGFAHGFVVLSDMAQLNYKVDNYYAPDAEATILYNDKDLEIDWKFDEQKMILSPKDSSGLSFKEWCNS